MFTAAVDPEGMLGSTPAELLPSGGPIESALTGPVTHDHGAPAPDAACHEPSAALSLLRGRGDGLVEAEDLLRRREHVAVDTIVAQLSPIRSHESLASSFSREANPDDAVVRAAYAQVWADLSLVIARRTTRRARIRAMTVPSRRGRLRGPG